MADVKKQHYVPQFYLRGFAHHGSQIFVYDKFTENIFRSNVRDVASSNRFYDFSERYKTELEQHVREKQSEETISEDAADQLALYFQNVQIVENRLSHFETKFANTLQRVIDGFERRRRFKSKHRTELALMAAVQYWRTYEQRQSIMQLSKLYEEKIMTIVEKMNQVKGTNYTAEDLEIEFDAEEASMHHKMQLLDDSWLQEITKIFTGHIWMIGVNETPSPFYTSDHPIATHAYKTDDWQSNTGIASPGIEITFPLSPKYVLIMLERGYHSHLSGLDEKLLPCKKDNINYYNSRQVYASYRQVYSPTNDFGIVETMIEEMPQLKEPQQRWG